MCCEKSSKAFGALSDGRSSSRSLLGERAACLPGSPEGARHVMLSGPPGTMDGAANEDTRDRTEQGAIWVSQNPHAAEPRRLECWEISGCCFSNYLAHFCAHYLAHRLRIRWEKVWGWYIPRKYEARALPRITGITPGMILCQII